MTKRLASLALIAFAMTLCSAASAYGQARSRCEKDDNSPSKAQPAPSSDGTIRGNFFRDLYKDITPEAPKVERKSEPPASPGAIRGDFFRDLYKDPAPRSEPKDRNDRNDRNDHSDRGSRPERDRPSPGDNKP